MTSTRLVLASSSPSRAALLRDAGVEPQVRVSDVDEDAILAAHTAGHGSPTVAEAVQLLATAKAEAVAAQLWPNAIERAQSNRATAPTEPAQATAPTEPAQATAPTEPAQATAPAEPLVVLGCDSLLEFDGEALGKPHTPERARERWQRIRGRSGVLHTGHQLITHSGQRAQATSHTTVHFADITDAEIAAYVATGEPLEVAGAFTIDGYGSAFITGIEGDHHGVIGLSLPLLRTLLAQLGLAWVDLWRVSPPPTTP